MKNVTEEQKMFAKEIAYNFWLRWKKKGTLPLGADESVRQMVLHRLSKEGWRKGSEESNCTIEAR